MSDKGMLSRQAINLPINVGTPVLANAISNPIVNPSPVRPKIRPALQQPTLGATGNRRMSSRIPNQQIDMGTEGMMRIGGNIMGAASQGALPALAAGMQTYGDIMDYNRAGKMAEYEQQMLRANEEAERQRLALKMKQENSEPDMEAVGALRTRISKLNAALNFFNEDTDSSLTGLNWRALASRLKGKSVGNEDEAKRLLLQEVRLDSVMERVAQTKGAISNKEMELFASQAPTLNSNDVVWVSWIKRQLAMQEIVLQRLQTGTQVDPNAPIEETMPNLPPIASGTSSGNNSTSLSPEAESFLNPDGN